MAIEKYGSAAPIERAESRVEVIRTSANLLDQRGSVHKSENGWICDVAWIDDLCRHVHLESIIQPQLDSLPITYSLTVESTNGGEPPVRYRYNSVNCYIRQCDTAWQPLKNDEMFDHTAEVIELLKTLPPSTPLDPNEEKEFREIAAGIVVEHIVATRKIGDRVLRLLRGKARTYERIVEYIEKQETVLSEADIRAAYMRWKLSNDR